MKNGEKVHAGRLTAMAIALFLFVASVALATGPEVQPLVSLTYSPDSGIPVTLEAMPFAYEGAEGAYWLYLPPEAVHYLASAILQIQDETERYAGGFSPASGQLLSDLGFENAGSSPLHAVPIEYHALDERGEAVAVFWVFVSIEAQEPELPTEEPSSATVMLRYFDEDGVEFEQATLLELTPGEHQVPPSPRQLPEGYELISPALVSVRVDAQGANPSEIVFRYRRTVSVEEPAVAVEVSVAYKDEAGKVIAWGQSVLCAPFELTRITATPEILPEGWTLSGPDVVEVWVDKEGASPQEAVFRVRRSEPLEEPPVALAQEVPIYYLDESDRPIAPAGSIRCEPWVETQVVANPVGLPEGYELASPGVQIVYVDQDGARPTAVVFTYKKMEGLPQESLQETPSDPPLDEPESTPWNVTDPPGTPVPDGVPINLWSEVVSKSVNFRKEASTKSAMQGTFPEGHRFFVLEQKTIGSEVWYRAMTEGREGFVMAEFLRLFSKEESDSFQQTLPTPAPEAVWTQEPVISGPVEITIHFVDEAGEPVASPVEYVCQDGTNTVAADPADLPEGYELIGDAVQYVRVAENRADPPMLTFVYRYAGHVATPAPTKTPEPAPQVAIVNVFYRDQDGKTLHSETATCVEGESNIIHSFPGLLEQEAPGRYELADAAQKTVSVDRDGVASPPEIIFLFKDLHKEITKEIAVHYRLEGSGEAVAPSGVEMCRVGGNDIFARPSGLPDETYELVSENPQRVSLSEDGVLTPAELVFLYIQVPPKPTDTPTPATPEPSPVPDGVPIDLWAETTSNVNFRSSPSDASTSNRIENLKKGTKLWAYDRQTVDGKSWYAVRVNGRDGFIMADFVSLYSQQESDAYQRSLKTPMPTQTAELLDEPTQPPEETATSTPEATSVPSPTATSQIYQGYALTLRQVALRTGISEKDETILATLPADTLLRIWGQASVNGVIWDSAEAIAWAQTGFVPDDALRHISAEEAQPYLNMLKPLETATPAPTAQPVSVSGYAMVLGANVPMRSYFNTNAEITAMLPADSIVEVLGQEYSQDESWHIAGYAGRFGYIREDQLRMLNALEQVGYLESLKTPTPSPLPTETVSPTTSDSLSSYGYVNTDNVRLRKEPGSGAQLKMMQNNAFALVLGTVIQDGELWYRINQGGTEGFVMGKFFNVLPLGQLQTFLQSEAYLSANTLSANTVSTSSSITSVEDFNKTVWQNPTLMAQASYEPFNPLGTPTPSVEAIMTPELSPSPTLEALASFAPMPTTEPQTQRTSSFSAWAAIGIVAVLGGGGGYAYYLYRENRKRAAQRAAQRRQQQTQQASYTASGQPYARPAQPRGGATSPYDPPRPRSPVPQHGTLPYQSQKGSAPAQQTAAFRSPGGGTAGQSTGATPYVKPVGGLDPTQPAAAFRPPEARPPGQPGSTVPYARPSAPGPTQPETAFRPLGGGAAGQAGSTAPYKQPTGAPARTTDPAKMPTPPPGTGSSQATEASETKQPAPETRRRRSDRHSSG